MSFIEFENVHKRYQTGEIVVNAADGVTFDIERGEFCLIVGASGAGKSTVLNLLGGLDACTDGNIRVDGRLISGLSENELIEYRRNDVGFVFQFYNLMPNLTALENVELSSQIVKKPLDPLRVLTKVGLKDRKDNFPSQLSGGEQQRVSIARALTKSPKLLLCDEPTGALDYNTSKQILDLLWHTCKETGTTVIVISHNTALSDMADRIVTLRSGKVVQIAVNDHPVDVKDLQW